MPCIFCRDGRNAPWNRRGRWSLVFWTKIHLGSWTATIPRPVWHAVWWRQDQILVLYFGRFTCLYRVVRRWLQNRGRVRCSAAPGCEEKLDLGIYLLGALAGSQPCLSWCPAGPDMPRLTRISLCCCAASASSGSMAEKGESKMGYKLADLTQQPEQASLKTTSATEGSNPEPLCAVCGAGPIRVYVHHEK